MKPGELAVQVLLLLTLVPSLSQAGSYKNATSIFSTLLEKSNYNPQVRPLLDQDSILYVYVGFEIFSIMEVNDADQSFRCNGQLSMVWFDEVLTWNESDYGGVDLISPKVEDVFRPRVILLNTLGARDLFSEEFTPVVVHSSGFVLWLPGSIFPVSCKLDLSKYPFDEQTCQLEMVLMNFGAEHLQFIPNQNNVSTNFFVENEEWDIVESFVSATVVNVSPASLSSLNVSFKLKRKPKFLVMSVLLPIVFLSLLNLLVFVIPVESGEKISFGITVLLALTVFMSIISGMLPRSSGTMPYMVIYIFALLVISVLTVMDTIIIVMLHHKEEEKDGQLLQKTDEISATLLSRTNYDCQTPSAQANSCRFPTEQQEQQQQQQQQQPQRQQHEDTSISTSSSTSATIPKSKCCVKRPDAISLIVFAIAWSGLTIAFLVELAIDTIWVSTSSAF